MIKAIALTGPTASGKTALSLAIAEKIGAEIISCDSMQIYKRMDIGTAKATPKEKARATHHLIDIIMPSEQYSAEDYRRDALAAARDITERGKIPLFVGGTGLYIDTLMRAQGEGSPPSDPAVRATLTEYAEKNGVDALWQRLAAVDPESAAKAHKNNLRRVVRALEIYEVSGKTKSYFDELSRRAAPDAEIFMLTLDFHDRENLYSRVNERVDAMMSEGLVDEVSELYREGLLRPEYTSAQAIGYKEIISYLEGKCTLDEAVEAIKLSTRRYAKRQLTWFRHEKNARVIYADLPDGSMKSREDMLFEALSIADEFRKEYELTKG